VLYFANSQVYKNRSISSENTNMMASTKNAKKIVITYDVLHHLM